MDTPTNLPVRFGVFELDERAGELRRSGRRVALQPQPLEILRALLERPGEVVTREELHRRIWRNGAYVDFDRSLNKAIGKLRDALGDDADSPRYIETLPRHGYRFIPVPEAHAHHAAAPREVAAPNAQPITAPTASGREQVFQSATISSPATKTAAAQRSQLPALALIAALAVAALLTGLYALWRARSPPSVASAHVEAPSPSGLPANVAPTSVVAFSPPPHSIVVLPFVNMSGDPSQEYFSDGLTEELLNSLSRIDGLQVAARTSSFSFQGEHPDIATVAHKLNVASVLQGSVRRSGHTIRVTAQLDDAVTGYHLWSQSYDRDLGDVLQLQTEIATAVATALKITLLGDMGAKIELGGTRNPAAFEAYLRGSRAYFSPSDTKDVQTAIDAFSEAIRLDSSYALAYVARSVALSLQTDQATNPAAALDSARADARRAIELTPELGEGHVALAVVFENTLDFLHASEEFDRAFTLTPGNARVLRNYARFSVLMGRTVPGIAAAHRAVVLDPLNANAHGALCVELFYAHRYSEAITACGNALALSPDVARAAYRGFGYYALGNYQSARSACEIHRESESEPVFGKFDRMCLAITYDKLGRHADAEAERAKVAAPSGNPHAFQHAEIYAQWGNTAKALEWLETAYRVRDSGLELLRVDPFIDPLRQEPRFQAIEHELKFPNSDLKSRGAETAR